MFQYNSEREPDLHFHIKPQFWTAFLVDCLHRQSFPFEGTATLLVTLVVRVGFRHLTKPTHASAPCSHVSFTQYSKPNGGIICFWFIFAIFTIGTPPNLNLYCLAALTYTTLSFNASLHSAQAFRGIEARHERSTADGTDNAGSGRGQWQSPPNHLELDNPYSSSSGGAEISIHCAPCLTSLAAGSLPEQSVPCHRIAGALFGIWRKAPMKPSRLAIITCWVRYKLC